MSFDSGGTTQGCTFAMKCDRPKQVLKKDVHLCLTNIDVAAERTKINYIVQLKKYYFMSNYMT